MVYIFDGCGFGGEKMGWKKVEGEKWEKSGVEKINATHIQSKKESEKIGCGNYPSLRFWHCPTNPRVKTHEISVYRTNI